MTCSLENKGKIIFLLDYVAFVFYYLSPLSDESKLYNSTCSTGLRILWLYLLQRVNTLPLHKREVSEVWYSERIIRKRENNLSHMAKQSKARRMNGIFNREKKKKHGHPNTSIENEMRFQVRRICERGACKFF